MGTPSSTTPMTFRPGGQRKRPFCSSASLIRFSSVIPLFRYFLLGEVLYFMGTGGVCNCTQVHVPSPSPALWGLMVDYNHIAYRLLLPKDVCDL